VTRPFTGNTEGGMEPLSKALEKQKGSPVFLEMEGTGRGEEGGQLASSVSSFPIRGEKNARAVPASNTERGRGKKPKEIVSAWTGAPSGRRIVGEVEKNHHWNSTAKT